ncbi:MAG: hypothetical protein A4E45_01317 [Methanosaeta sp. PtaB.Bin039]|nr:MAG: hypothetical protein A4E45_01317 [Methanosaeta sp. PtaB.Bin039]OPY44604.1 MAG: hypothetical protein A4E47_01456 [Methanosaeta sp. PtaU1.Bin028]HOT06408.1 methanogenesis marker 3 protein [Methanotrichaceae archaeon]HQF16179.1 methanogenesis marker 3 protein [Methanotrichaceae archaeon]HQI90915.1 methanogenesis marker 3 protein [Methanotrichaceae archaeon]
MKVTVDGLDVLLPEGSDLDDALRAAGSKMLPKTVIGIIKGRGEKARQTNSYWLKTTKGKLRIELVESEMQDVWHECVSRIGELGSRWSNSSAIAWGNFPSTISPDKDAHEYNRWEVALGASGFEPDRTQIIFVKKRHSGAYGVPSSSRGVFARVVGGKSTLDRLEADDRLLGIEPIVEWEDLTHNLVTDDLSTPMTEGMEVYTRFVVDLIGDAPNGSEFLHGAARDGYFTVSAVSSSYISSHVLHGEPITFEHREPRVDGSVTIRAAGRGLGDIFIYKADRTSNPGHSVVGKVTSGMELVKLAQAGHRLAVSVRPERFMAMSMPLQQAIEMADRRGIECSVDGYSGEDAVVVEQSPITTMQVLKEKKVTLKAIPSSRLVAIQLYDDLAPKSLDYFRHVVGLKERPVGPLPVFFVYENTVLFKPVVDAVRYKELLPENKPTGPVPAGSLGLTNQVAKKTGLLGVKFVDDRRYGPSGEKFEGTNIIGKVLDLDKLKDVKEGEMVYVLEVRQ